MIVIEKELKRISEWLFQQYKIVYDGDAPNYYDAYKTVDGAIELLKEQNQRIWELLTENERLNDVLKEREAVEPIVKPMAKGLGYFCGACWSILWVQADTISLDWNKREHMFCHHCGQAVKWE